MDAWVRLVVAVVALLAVLPLEASGNAELSASASITAETDVTLMVAGVASPWLKKSFCVLYELLCKGDKVTCKLYSCFGTILVILEIFFQMVFACISKDAMYVTVAGEVTGLVAKCKLMPWCNAQYLAFYELVWAWIPCLKGILKLGLLSSVLTGVSKTIKNIAPNKSDLLGGVVDAVSKLL